jgi:phosphoserine aminotransferase
MFNTPPCFALYTIGLVLKWLKANGGISAMELTNSAKAKILYDLIDHSSFYKGHAQAESRSKMNITFNLPTPQLEAKFIQEAALQGFDGLKGHRSVGGVRASIYNAFPLQGVKDLAQFMEKFEKDNN